MHKITSNTKVYMPVCPSDWAINDFAPFGAEAKQRGREMQRYIKEKFHRNCTFFKRDGELFVIFRVSRVSHKEINWLKRVFFLDDREHTFKDVGV
ncbi:hypothetical protein vBAspALolek_15 [Aeromonas phage vB_AspA_Lolek]|nr:hypothetical protein vBAspALolek_15 [Aeromonas phage vB_AspA_Lolek]